MLPDTEQGHGSYRWKALTLQHLPLVFLEHFVCFQCLPIFVELWAKVDDSTQVIYGWYSYGHYNMFIGFNHGKELICKIHVCILKFWSSCVRYLNTEILLKRLNDKQFVLLMRFCVSTLCVSVCHWSSHESLSLSFCGTHMRTYTHRHTHRHRLTEPTKKSKTESLPSNLSSPATTSQSNCQLNLWPFTTTHTSGTL